jgi:hypothetical protein
MLAGRRVAAPAAPADAPAQYVFVKRAGDAPAGDEAYAKLAILLGDDVADLAARAVAAFPRWGAADAGQLRLYLVVHTAGGSAPTAEVEQQALAGAALFPASSLQDAGVGAGALLLARVPARAAPRAAPPAAAAVDAVALLRAYDPRALSSAEASALRVHAALRHEWEVSQAVHRGGAQPVPSVARALACEDMATERGLAALLLPLYPLTVAAAEAALPPGRSSARDDLALAVALSGLAAVAAFAAAGWAHGDIKPANMMLAAAADADADAADCVLIDFGTARRHGEGFPEGSSFALTEERTASVGFDLVCLGATLAAVQHELLIGERGMTRASLLDDVNRERRAAAAGAARGAAAPLPPASLAAQRCLELGARGAGVGGDDLAALVAEVQAAAQRMRAGR